MSEQEEKAKDRRITMGELRERIEYYDDDCVIRFSTTEKGEVFFGRIKAKDRDENDIKPDGNAKITSVSFELDTP